MSTPVSDAPPHATPHATTSTAAGLAAVLERITDAFFALDGHWRFTYVNDQAQRLLARTREELLGRCVWDEFPDAVGST
ncbi:MAG: PAS domain-containing protein, partial [Gemmatirosa sp.]